VTPLALASIPPAAAVAVALFALAVGIVIGAALVVVSLVQDVADERAADELGLRILRGELTRHAAPRSLQ
jgi:anti-sigma factor RsiW